MVDFEEIIKYKLLNKFTEKMSLIRICASVYSMYLDAAWLVCDIYGKKLFGWSFLERRQLFLELIAYHLEHEKIKFGKSVNFAQEAFEWNESTNIEDTIAYLEKGFTKSEKVFNDNEKGDINKVFEDVNVDSNEWLKWILEHPIENFDIDMYGYIFSYCPVLAYWNEKSQSWVWTD